MEHRRVVMEELMDKINVLRREFGDTNARLTEDVEFATNKNIKLEREKKGRILEIMRKDQKILRLQASVSDEKIEKFIEKEHKKTDVLHKSIMEAHKEILIRQEEQDGELKPWRKCRICFEEYEEELEHSPQVLECGHTVCYRCLWKMADPDGVLCPFDRITTICRKRNLRLLLKNFAVLQM
ncbi:Protein CBG20824 [Caenorhabditis briggsae]|uniref:RING-type domain-containing protein n=2 Tax=Caenorhabditis briggsae TaxID=6238 RepID=A0AAE9DNH7_CAEBR|nr:Protein CBG20824 [Caenorhabditis briggsae]ULU07510.1 hypothetical protein L3Y34_018906 [Caenorhabditis briggsae]CAP37767.1 Protein CBG20824 [Caenorhabditis briggsae]